MKIYVFTEISSGEVQLEFDNQTVFTSKSEAVKAVKNKFKTSYNSLKDYGEIVDYDYSDDYYTITLEDNEGTTIYDGYLKEFDVEA